MDARFQLQAEADQALGRMGEALRKCGWSRQAGIDYPKVTAGGLSFRVLQDLDGNGYPFDAGSGNLRIYDGGRVVWHLARYVDGVEFSTFNEDFSLQYREIRVTLRLRMQDRRGDPVVLTESSSIFMRN